jgi:hypothetical protein
VIDLERQLQELADAGTRYGSTPGAAAATRRGRLRRRRLAAGTASLLAVVLLAGTAGAEWLTDRLAPPTSLPAAERTTTLPALVDMQVRADQPPPGSVEAGALRDLKAALRGCPGGASDRVEIIGYGRSREFRRIWMVVAKPPASGETAVCWTAGLFELDGAGSFSGESQPSAAPGRLSAGGTNAEEFGTVEGYAPRQATRVRVRFRDGQPPQDLPVMNPGGRYPVNFYVGLFPQQNAPEGTRDWAPQELLALDETGHTVARCTIGPPFDPGTACAGN